MNKVFVGFGLSLFMACAPELGAGKGERCDVSEICGEGLVCYRGYCVSERASDESPVQEGDDQTGEVTEPTTDAFDAGVASLPEAGTRGAEPLAKDASVAPGESTGARTSNPSQPSAPAVTPQPTTTSDASAPAATAKPAATPNPKPSTTPGAVDAGSPAPPSAPIDAGTTVTDAGAGASLVPDASFVLPKNCTLEECCAELARGSDNEGKGGGKSCGCEDPALLRTLSCVVVAPLGVLL